MAEYGITGFSAYVPRLRLPRAVIADAHRWMAPNGKGKGSRAFCGWDEDALTMAVEAGRGALSGCSHAVEAVTVASTTMPNSDLQHSAVIATVLDLPDGVRTGDPGHSRRAATSALVAALERNGTGELLIASEYPLAKPASPQEMQYGAGAVAFTLGQTGVVARLVAAGSKVSPLVDHFRKAGSKFDYYWEERWVRDEGYGKAVAGAVSATLADAGLAIGDIDYLVASTPAAAGSGQIAKAIGFGGTIVSPLADACGFTGTADPLLGLAGALEQAGPGEKILVIGFGQGCDVIVLETTEAISGYTSARPLSRALANGMETDSYLRMLSFQGLYEPDWGMRGEKEVRTALTDLYRSVNQIWKFHAGKCQACGTLQFPQLAYCISCQAPTDQFDQVSLADREAKVLTYTADHLTYYPAPPLYAGFVQFGEDARLLMEIVDVGQQGVMEGMPVRMVFRIKDRDNLRGWTRYTWKATPEEQEGEGD